MALYERIKDLADQHHITIKELEEKLNFSNGSMRRWNIHTPSTDKLEKVAEHFDVSTDYLLGRTTDRQSKKGVDLKDKNSILMYDGKLIPEEDMETIRRIVEGLRNADKR